MYTKPKLQGLGLVLVLVVLVLDFGLWTLDFANHWGKILIVNFQLSRYTNDLGLLQTQTTRFGFLS